MRKTIPEERLIQEWEELENYDDSRHRKQSKADVGLEGEHSGSNKRTFKNRRVKDITIADVVKVKPPRLPSKRTIEEQDTTNVTKELLSRPVDLLDDYILEFLGKIKEKQDVNWKRNETKARSHRHIVCGFHETFKHLLADNVKIIFIAHNIDEEYVNGSKSGMFHDVSNVCLIKKIPLIFALSKKSLSKVVKKHPYINCIGVMRYEGFQVNFFHQFLLLPAKDAYKKIVELWKSMRLCIAYHTDQSSLFA